MKKMKLSTDIYIYIIYRQDGEWPKWQLDPGFWRLFGCNPGDPM